MTSYIVVTHFGVGRINKVPAEGRRATHEFVFSFKANAKGARKSAH